METKNTKQGHRMLDLVPTLAVEGPTCRCQRKAVECLIMIRKSKSKKRAYSNTCIQRLPGVSNKSGLLQQPFFNAGSTKFI